MKMVTKVCIYICVYIYLIFTTRQIADWGIAGDICHILLSILSHLLKYTLLHTVSSITCLSNIKKYPRHFRSLAFSILRPGEMWGFAGSPWAVPIFPRLDRKLPQPPELLKIPSVTHGFFLAHNLFFCSFQILDYSLIASYVAKCTP